MALITGASRGQGETEARLFARAGARVVLTDVLLDLGQHVAHSIGADGGAALFLQLDVANPDEWHEVVRHTVQTYNRLDILVNNAGIAQRGGVENTSVEDWNRTIVRQPPEGGWLLTFFPALPMISQCT